MSARRVRVKCVMSPLLHHCVQDIQIRQKIEKLIIPQHLRRNKVNNMLQKAQIMRAGLIQHLTLTLLWIIGPALVKY